MLCFLLVCKGYLCLFKVLTLMLVDTWNMETPTFLLQVLQWMEDAGIRPSNGMFHDISSFAEKSSGSDYAIINERIGMLIFIHLIIQLCFRYTLYNGLWDSWRIDYVGHLLEKRDSVLWSNKNREVDLSANFNYI